MIPLNLRRPAVIIHDLLMVAVAWILALLVRLSFQPSAEDWVAFQVLPLVILVQALVFWRYGLYRGLWKFACLPDLWNILRSAFLGAVIIALVLVLFNRLQNVPRTSLIIFPVFLSFLLGMPRLFYRVWREHSVTAVLKSHERQSVLVIGAGRAADMLVRDMRRDEHYQAIGFLDDNPRLKGAIIQGLPVLGNIKDLAKWTEKTHPELLFIAMPSASDSQMQRIVEYCEQSGVSFRTLPKLDELSNRQASLSTLHEVSLDDLLGREKIKLDWETIEDGLSGKVVMVSGGGGSIGSELCHQIARLQPKSLVIFERSEFNLYQIERSLQQASPETTLHIYLGDVGDINTVNHVLSTYKPNIIFHAAAYKHVPMLQNLKREAIYNNVLGTRTLAEAAVRHDCQAFVMISTDKAVNPTNVMGTTKRISEIFCQALNERSKTRFITVRFGNVLGSAGSVVPLFQEQIAQGGPVTVTHPDINRYFMTIPEACQLILQAGAMGYGGEIFVLDMGLPIKIRYLAEQMIRLSGKEPDKDIDIIYIGLRPGEKLHEELFHAEEALMSKTSHNKILLASHRVTAWDVLTDTLALFEKACFEYDEEALQQGLKTLVPEFHNNEKGG